MAFDATPRCDEWNREIALDPQLKQHLIARKMSRDAVNVAGDPPREHRLARRSLHVVLVLVEKAIAGPRCERAHAPWYLGQFRDKRVAHIEGLGQMAHELAKELLADGRRRAFGNLPQQSQRAVLLRP